MTDRENLYADLSKRWSKLADACEADLPATTIGLARDLLADFPEFGATWKILGSALIDLVRYEEAETALMKAALSCPPERLWIPLCERGRLDQARGNYDKAESWYLEAIEVDPQEASPRIYLGALLAMAGRLDEAEAIHRDATQCRTGHIDEAWLNLGLVLRARGRYEEAADCFRKALEIDPEYTAAKHALLDVRFALAL